MLPSRIPPSVLPTTSLSHCDLMMTWRLRSYQSLIYLSVITPIFLMPHGARRIPKTHPPTEGASTERRKCRYDSEITEGRPWADELAR